MITQPKSDYEERWFKIYEFLEEEFSNYLAISIIKGTCGVQKNTGTNGPINIFLASHQQTMSSTQKMRHSFKGGATVEFYKTKKCMIIKNKIMRIDYHNID